MSKPPADFLCLKTMLSIINPQAQDLQGLPQPCNTNDSPSPHAILPPQSIMDTGGLSLTDSSVTQALEIARECSDGGQDPSITKLLEAALFETWNKIQKEPCTYVMTKLEYAVFNYFQHRFAGNQMAMHARRRFWENHRKP